MAIRIILHALFRMSIPEEIVMQVEQNWNSGATIDTLLKSLGLPNNVVVVINAEVVSDLMCPIMTGDEVLVFTPISGG